MEKPPNSKKKLFNNYLKFSAIGFQMIAVILIGFGIGYWIDNKMQNEKPVASMVCTLIFVFISLYLVIKELKILTEDND